jgi:glycosyltransferase involved in cell wall biosynthesis
LHALRNALDHTDHPIVTLVQHGQAAAVPAGTGTVPDGAAGAPVAPRRVLHVVQKFSSGVGSAIAQYTRSVPEVEHHLLSGTAVDGEGDLADQAVFASVHRMSGSTAAKSARVHEVVARLRPDVVHAHSSHGGLYARLGVRSSAVPVVYTPHCYAFERRDVGPLSRAAFWAAEALLAANTSVFAACAPRELALSSWPTRRVPSVLVPNIAPPGGARGEVVRGLVVGGGRLSPQKDPAFFAAAVALLRASVPGLRAVWLGDGDAAARAALEAAGVEVTGWLPRAQALELLGSAALYLHSARWEGFPLMVTEAAALGVPTLVRRLPSFADVPADLTLGGAHDVALALAVLTDPASAAANAAGWADLLRGNTLEVQRAALLSLYALPTAA